MKSDHPESIAPDAEDQSNSSVKEAALLAIETGECRPPVSVEDAVFKGVMGLLRQIVAAEGSGRQPPADYSDALARTALDSADVVRSEFGERVGDVLLAYKRRTTRA